MILLALNFKSNLYGTLKFLLNKMQHLSTSQTTQNEKQKNLFKTYLAAECVLSTKTRSAEHLKNAKTVARRGRGDFRRSTHQKARRTLRASVGPQD